MLRLTVSFLTCGVQSVLRLRVSYLPLGVRQCYVWRLVFFLSGG